MILGIVILEYARAIREEKIHCWDNLVIQYIQELCWLVVPRPGQLKQPQIITLQFADLNWQLLVSHHLCIINPWVYIQIVFKSVFYKQH